MSVPSWLGASHLTAPLSRLSGGGHIVIEAWASEPIRGGMGDALGVWSVSGSASIDGVHAPFTLVLKGWATPPGASDPTAWNWPGREPRAYTSGVLERLPGGVTAPACLGTITPGDGTTWLWLTPISAGALPTWEIGHFAVVARALGRFNGAYLTGEPLPRADWLSHQWTRRWTEDAADVIARLDTWAMHPRVARMIPPEMVGEIRRLWGERHRWFAALDRLPRTFAHLDAFRRNAFLRPGPGGALQTCLIDWTFAGIAAVGEDAVALVASSWAFGDAPGISQDQLDAAVFAAYLDGLRDAGWTGDAQLARLGYAGSLVMRYAIGTLRAGLPMVADERNHPIVERNFGMPLASILDLARARHEWYLERAEEVRDLLATMPPSFRDAPGA